MYSKLSSLENKKQFAARIAGVENDKTEER